MTIKIIDNRKAILEIMKKYGERYHFNPKSHQAAADLWGATSNEHGVAQNRKEETLVHIGQCKGEMTYVETTKGHFLVGLRGQTAIGGFGYAPSVWSRCGFASYWDAREHCIKRLMSFFEKEAISNNSCSGISNRQNAKKAFEILRGELTPQLDLF